MAMITRPEARLAISSSVGWSGFWARVGRARTSARAAGIRRNRFTGNIFLWVHHTVSLGWGILNFRFEISEEEIIRILLALIGVV